MKEKLLRGEVARQRATVDNSKIIEPPVTFKEQTVMEGVLRCPICKGTHMRMSMEGIGRCNNCLVTLLRCRNGLHALKRDGGVHCRFWLEGREPWGCRKCTAIGKGPANCGEVDYIGLPEK